MIFFNKKLMVALFTLIFCVLNLIQSLYAMEQKKRLRDEDDTVSTSTLKKKKIIDDDESLVPLLIESESEDVKLIKKILGIKEQDSLSIKNICLAFENKIKYPEYPGQGALNKIGSDLPKPVAFFTKEQLINLIQVYIQKVNNELKKQLSQENMLKLQYVYSHISWVLCLKNADAIARICAMKVVGTSLNTQTLHQKKQLKTSDRLVCIGDIHGSIHSLLRVLYDMTQRGLNTNSNLLKDNFTLNKQCHAVFTGDYCDRGMYGTDVVGIALILKIINWDYVTLQSGNHEELHVNNCYGLFSNLVVNPTSTVSSTTPQQPQIFPGEISFKYGDSACAELLPLFCYLYNTFMSACWYKTPYDKWLLSIHGGFDPNKLEQIQKTLLQASANKTHELICSDEKCVNKYHWYDFFIKDDKVCMYCARGEAKLPLVEDVLGLMHENNIDAIIRGHQHNLFGLKLVTQDLDYWKNIFPNSNVLPLSLPIPVFILSTATEIVNGPQAASYAVVTIGDSPDKSTLAPIEIAFNSNEIINKAEPQFENDDLEDLE
jgi:hypothetical protein